jgi:hypothetical protein
MLQCKVIQPTTLVLVEQPQKRQRILAASSAKRSLHAQRQLVIKSIGEIERLMTRVARPK